jgi:hypothetical protein
MLNHLFGKLQTIYKYALPPSVLLAKLCNLQDDSKRLKSDPLVDFEVVQEGFKMAVNPFENASIKLSSVLKGEIVQQNPDETHIIVTVQARSSLRVFSFLIFSLIIVRLSFSNFNGTFSNILSILLSLTPLVLMILAAKKSNVTVSDRYLKDVHGYLIK